MALTNEQIRKIITRRKLMANLPGLHPVIREYINDLETALGSGGEGVFPTTTTSTTTSSSSSSTTN